MDMTAELTKRTEQIENIIKKYLPEEEGYQKQVIEAMNYSFLAGGKRLRPMLMLETYRMFGGKSEVIEPFMAAIEMIHTYSLIHDDLPAMDDDTLRRGKPTCHVQFDEATAILAGDALLTQAFLLGAMASEDALVNCAIVKALSRYAGADGMVLGQIKDLEGEVKEDLTLAELKDIHYYKTGRLLTLPLVCAAYLTHHEEDIPAWEQIGSDLGLSFQIQDDILDVTSTVEELGKNINSDAQNNKRTYVSLLGIEEAQKEASFYYERAQQRLHELFDDAHALDAIFVALTKRKN